MDQENNITLFLNQTTPEQFILWLEDTTRQLRVAYPLKVGQCTVEIMKKTAANEAAIQASYYITDSKDQLYISDFDVMEFQWFSIGDRLQLNIKHLTERPLIHYVNRVMVEIAKNWPETAQEIVNHFGWLPDIEKDEQPVITDIKGSDRWSYPDPAKRKEIVDDYRKAKSVGRVTNKHLWAVTKYGITGNTLKNYEREFPEMET